MTGNVTRAAGIPSIGEMLAPPTVTGTRFTNIVGGYKRIGGKVYVDIFAKINFDMSVVTPPAINGYDTGLKNFPQTYAKAIQSLTCDIVKRDNTNDRYTGYSQGIAYMYQDASGVTNLGFGTYTALVASDNCYAHIFGAYDAA